MTLEEALKILDNVCAGLHGTRVDHVVMQQALQVVTAATVAEPVKPIVKKLETKKKEPDGNN